MGVFSISPVELSASGKKLLENAESFKTNSENIFKTVDEMVHRITFHQRLWLLLIKSIAIVRILHVCVRQLLVMVNSALHHLVR